MRNLALNKTLWLLTALLSLIAALAGVIRPALYSRLIAPAQLPGIISQDIVSALAALLILLLAARVRESDMSKQIIILGALGHLFYAYGIYAIERTYNALYLVYLAILGLSFYAIVCGVASLRQDLLSRLRLPRWTRYASVGLSLFTPLLFSTLWISQLLPLMQSGRKIETLYSIYILDLCFIMPAFVIVAILAARNRGLGLALAPALFVDGLILLFSVALGGPIALLYQQPANMGEAAFYLIFAALFMLLATLHLRNLRLEAAPDSGALA